MTTHPLTTVPLPVRVTRRLEEARGLDAAVRTLRPAAKALVADDRVRGALQGRWLGHALHPLLTDLPIGMWTSATVLDLVGGEDARPAARRLVGLGLAAVAPTAVTGWAEWASIDQERERRVGVAHAAANVVTVGLYVASYRARGRSQHLRGTALGLAGAVALSATGYLGGHLVAARKVSSRHPVFDPPTA